MKIVGIRKESGKYNDKPWTSYIVTCEHEKKDSDELSVGSNCDVYRVRGVDFDHTMMTYKASDVSEFIGKSIAQVYYNQYGKVSGFVLGDN